MCNEWRQELDSKEDIKWWGILTHSMVIAALFAIAPVLGAKIGEVSGVVFACGVIAIALIYSFMDVVNEVWGKPVANRVIITATAVRIALYMIVIPIVMAIPASSHSTDIAEVFDRTWRVFVAGEIAILAGNLVFDIPFFAWLKKKRLKGGFWVRTNLTNLFSTVLSVALFMTMAFWGNPDAPPVWKLSIGQITMRTGITFLLSFPFAIWAKYLKGKVHANTDN